MQTSHDRDEQADIGRLVQRYHDNGKVVEQLRSEIETTRVVLYTLAHRLSQSPAQAISASDAEAMTQLPRAVDALRQALVEKAEMDTQLRQAGLERIIC